MQNEKYGFVYIWFDKKRKRFYIGSHWGTKNDGYICSSPWMHQSYKYRKQDFKRRIISIVTTNRQDLLKEEQRWLNMIKDHELAKFNSTTKKRETVRYYNLTKSTKAPWHQHPEYVKTIGQKISHSKKGKSTGPCSPEKAKKISEAKIGRTFSEEHRQKLREAQLGKKHSEERKQKTSERVKAQWDSGIRKKAEPVKKMTKDEQAECSANRLKKLWSDPVWKENQINRLKEGSKRRYSL